MVEVYRIKNTETGFYLSAYYHHRDADWHRRSGRLFRKIAHIRSSFTAKFKDEYRHQYYTARQRSYALGTEFVAPPPYTPTLPDTWIVVDANDNLIDTLNNVLGLPHGYTA